MAKSCLGNLYQAMSFHRQQKNRTIARSLHTTEKKQHRHKTVPKPRHVRSPRVDAKTAAMPFAYRHHETRALDFNNIRKQGVTQP